MVQNYWNQKWLIIRLVHYLPGKKISKKISENKSYSRYREQIIWIIILTKYQEINPTYYKIAWYLLVFYVKLVLKIHCRGSWQPHTIFNFFRVSKIGVRFIDYWSCRDLAAPCLSSLMLSYTFILFLNMILNVKSLITFHFFNFRIRNRNDFLLRLWKEKHTLYRHN